MKQTYELKIIHVTGIHWKPAPLSIGVYRDAPNLYVAIDVDGSPVHATGAIRNWVAMWNHICSLSADSPSSLLALQVFHKPLAGKGKCLAKAKITIAALLEKCGPRGPDQNDASISLIHVGEAPTGGPAPTLVVRMSTSSYFHTGTVAVVNAIEDIKPVQDDAARPTVVKLGASGVKHSDLLSAIGTVLSGLAIVVRIGTEFAKIHPYANAAWTVLTSVYAAVQNQQETDEKVVQLVQMMADIYSSAEKIESLPGKMEHLEDVLSALVKQTVECALFIREYTGNGFCGRLVASIRSKYGDRIKDFVAAFVQLRASLDTAIAVQTTFVSTTTLAMMENVVQTQKRESLKAIQTVFVSTRILATVEDIERTQRLDSLKPVDMNGSGRKPCLAGTRRDMLSLITNWLSTPSDSGNPGNIIWLSGVAGAGKSTIATSVSEHFRGLDRLGAFLFFNLTDQVRSHPASVIRTMAFQLARTNDTVASAIYTSIRHDPALVDASIQIQFQKLLLDPLTSAQHEIPGPIIIILDALDECGDRQSRRELVSMITNQFPQLPSLFRFFVTSRPDSEIAARFETQPKITKLLLDITLPSSATDIRLYINHRLPEIRQQHAHRKLDPTWPGHLDTAALSGLSSGLFIWASTAMGMLLEAHDPTRTLRILLDKARNLDDMYAAAIESTGPWDPEKFPEEAEAFADDARAALSAVVLGKIPMSDVTIDALLGLEPKRPSALIFSKLGCVLQWAPGQLVRPLHASFADYLTDHARSGQKPWFIDPAIFQPQIARGCLQVLKNGLRFNICRLEDSRIGNTDIIDLSRRITDYISPHLSYSSRFWASHLPVTDSEKDLLSDDLLADLKDLMYKKFLFWLEVLSVLQETGVAIDALTVLGKLAKKNHDETLAEFAMDAVKFMIAFAPAIAHSAPHIYLSAVPLSPNQSKVKQQFFTSFIRAVDIQSSVGNRWPRLQRTIEGHTRAVRAVAFSSDGRRIVSGSDDKTIRVWDARTGALVAGPFNGHSDGIQSVGFSTDGEHIVSGSEDRTVRVWDARTGAAVAGPFEGHENWVRWVSFSPNGGRIISGGGRTIRIWNVHAGSPAGIILTTYPATVTSCSFSPKGDRIVSGSVDGLIHVFDAQTGDLVAGPFEGHNNKVLSVSFSPDGERLVSGSSDTTFRIWDVRKGSVVFVGSVDQHRGRVDSVAFSPDGVHIVSGHPDSTVRVWDAKTGALVGPPFEGHNHGVTSVTFSPDGRQIISGSVDHTVRVWEWHPEPVDTVAASKDHGECIEAGPDDETENFQTVPPHPGLSEGHSERVNSVAFSPEGDRIVSGSDDRTVCVWDARTGALVGDPFNGHRGVVTSVAYSPDGDRIVSGSADMTVRVWDARSGIMVAGPFEGHTASVRSVSFSPEGRRIVSGSVDKSICVWNAQTGNLLLSLPGAHGGAVLSVSFSPDGERVVSSSADSMVLVRDAHTGALVAGPFIHGGEMVNSVAFSPGGRHIVSGSHDTIARIWNLETGSEVPLLLQGHTRALYSVAFSRDGNYVVSGSHDTTVRVWDAKTGLTVAGPFEAHRTPVLSVNFSPAGKRVVSASRDTTIRVFEINTDCAEHLSFGNGSTLKDGWILNSTSQLILWVPPWLHHGLYVPHNSLVISRYGTTKLGFSKFVYGTSWEECINPEVRSK